MNTCLVLLVLVSLGAVARAELTANAEGQPQELGTSCADKCTTATCSGTCDNLVKRFSCGQNYCPSCRWAGWCDETCGFCKTPTTPSVCDGRSSVCSVLLDVPTKCAGAASSCPIGFFFHGHGGTNKAYAHGGAGHFAHEYGFIGVYPQGEMYQGRSGWNDGSMDGNKCEWNDFSCQQDPNDGNFTRDIIKHLRGQGASGRIYLWGGSNGANAAQIFAANAGDDLPITGISAGWGQLMSTPPRSGPAPFDWNQPTAKANQKVAGRPGDGRIIAQQAHHGDADTTIPYQGGPRFGSKVWTLMPEPTSDKTWAEHNGCTGQLTNTTGIPATYHSHQTGQEVDTTAVYWKWHGCPPTAPVEYYQVIGAPHGGASSIKGKDPFFIVFDFWSQVEAAHTADAVVPL